MEKKEIRFWIILIGATIICWIPACQILSEKWDAEQKRRHPIKVMKAQIYKPTSDVESYINRFRHVAQAEQKKFGIPASITLAQGILESGVGKSRLAVNHNNHFGIKCWCKGKKMDCIRMADDRPDDRFKRYSSAWESFRHHSIFVTKMRISVTKGANYKQWAKALKKAGYATKKTYAEDLIRIVQRYNLHQYDNI